MKRRILRGLFALMRNAYFQAESGNKDGTKNMRWLTGNLTAKPNLLKKAMCVKPESQVPLPFSEISLYSVDIRINDTESSYEAI